MAKAKSSMKNESRKTVFYKKKGGKAKKGSGPKDKKVSEYRGQGR